MELIKMTSLKSDYDVLSRRQQILKEVPDFIKNNLNPNLELREYQKEAIGRLNYYISEDTERMKPTHLLFHMATGSGKTLLMASNILYLYEKGYRNFLFFVNSTNIIEKTKENFLNPLSIKYLFNNKIKFREKEVNVNEIDNFEMANDDDINIVFVTIQGLHSLLTKHRENALTFEDFKDKKIVIISDEAHHINSWTKNSLNKEEELAKSTWEHTVNNLFNSNKENIMLEYTATVDLENKAIAEKYSNKIIYEYSLKQFRQDKFSKEVKVLQSESSNIQKSLKAIILSQYRRKIAEKNGLFLKPIVLMKSKTINDSKDFEEEFHKSISNLKVKDITILKNNAKNTIIEKAFDYFEKENISIQNLITELKEDFSESKCVSINSKEESEEKQILVNSLESHNNEIRCIFAVDKLNEGWDVLNLFDIVRLYDTRDSRGKKVGKTTMAEAQLIGRGARYFPFKLDEEQDKFKRKFDQDEENEMKVIEELYYHSSHNPKYIQELTTALRSTGIMPEKEPKTIQLTIKDYVKDSNFWKEGFIFVNKKIKKDYSKVKDITDIDIMKIYKCNLETGYTQERNIFVDELSSEQDKINYTIELNSFKDVILLKALSKLDFYKFSNLKTFFPKLQSINDFVKSLGSIKIEVRSSQKRFSYIDNDDRLNIALEVLNEIEKQIRSGHSEYEGTKLFIQNKVKDILKDKSLKLFVEDYSDKEFGVPMSNPNSEELRLDLSSKQWYIYNENYGTSEEKHFVQFMNSTMSKLEEKYSEIYLLRNENLFKIYRFSDGEATEPDFVLFLKEKNDEKIIQYQLFIEAKGNHLLKTDSWKEEMLTGIEDNYQLEILAENKDYKIIGMPFYNEDHKTDFVNKFSEKIVNL